MNNHTIKRGLVVALAPVAFMASGCGESAPNAAKATARPEKMDVTRFLLRNGEQPGYRRVETVFTEDAETFAEKAGLTKAERSRMRSAGMGTATYQPTEVPDSRGVTSVTLFASAQGARQWLAQEMREDYIRRQLPDGGKLRRFVVPGIPGAHGWSATKGPRIVGNIIWVQGRCMMVLGHESSGPFDGPLATGAHAIYRRTKGRCP